MATADPSTKGRLCIRGSSLLYNCDDSWMIYEVYYAVIEGVDLFLHSKMTRASSGRRSGSYDLKSRPMVYAAICIAIEVADQMFTTSSRIETNYVKWHEVSHCLARGFERL